MMMIVACISASAQANDLIRSKAQAGDGFSQYLMGLSYMAPHTADAYNSAIEWFEKSASNGCGKAAYYLGWMYENGEGVAINPSAAAIWYSRAKELGVTAETENATKYIKPHATSNSRNGSYANSTREKFDPSKPPILEVASNSIKFIDPNGNNAIDAGEKCYIQFKVVNKGKGTAKNCVAGITSADAISGLSMGTVDIPDIAVGKSAEVKIPITANMKLKTGNVDLFAQVNEPHGLGTDPIQMSIATKAFSEPKLEIVDYRITSTNGNTLKKKNPFDLQVLLQNLEHGTAEDVSVDFNAPEGVILMNTETSHENYASLTPGATKSIVYQLIVTDLFKGSTIPIDIKVREKYGKYAQNKHIDLQINQSMAANKIVVEENSPKEQSFDIQTASLSSDVDKVPTVATSKANNTFAVIIANESYNKEAAVPFAANDGKIFAEYCKNVLGLPEENVHLSVNATLNDMKHEIGWLTKVLETRNGEAKAIFYYAGHGIPDEASRNAYLLPVDGYGSDISTGYALEKIYTELGSVPSKEVTLFLDACFSGAKRDGGMLASARGIALKANSGQPVGNMVVFTAAQGDETAYPYKKEGHGLFTYYLLKELKETKGNTTLKQLGDYVSKNVSQQSIVINSKSQTPTVIPSKNVADKWAGWTLK